MKWQLITHSIVNQGKEDIRELVLPRAFSQYRFDDDGWRKSEEYTVGKNQEERGGLHVANGGQRPAAAKSARVGYTIRIYVFVIVNRLSVSYLYLRSKHTVCLQSAWIEKYWRGRAIRVNSTPERSTLRNTHSNNAFGIAALSLIERIPSVVKILMIAT